MMNINEIISRLKIFQEVTDDKDIAGYLDISAQDFSNRKQRGTLLTLIIRKVVNENVNLHWLLTGEGDMEKPVYEIPEGGKIRVAKEDKGVYTARPTIGKIVDMLEEMGDDDLREVLRFLEKEKLLRDLLEEKKAKRGG